MTSLTVDPDRVISEDEQKALVAVEVAERLAVRAHRRIEDIRQSLLGADGAYTDQVAASLVEVQQVLSLLTDVTTLRTITAVKDQATSDAISKAARATIQRGLVLNGLA